MNYKEILLNNFTIMLFSSLMFILNIPHTTGLRNILFYTLFITTIYFIVKFKHEIKILLKNKDIKQILIILLSITLYILFHSVFISYDTMLSLKEFKSQWIIPMLYFIVGIVLSIYSIKSKVLTKEVLITIIFFSMFIHILYIDLVALDKFFDTHNLIRRFGGLMDSPTGANYMTNILLAMIISEIIYRIRINKQILKIGNLGLFIVLVLTILSSFIEAIRHGSISILTMGLIGTIFIIYNNKAFSKKFKILLGLFLTILFLLPAVYSFKTDARWHSLLETIPIAMDTKNNLHWLNPSKYKAPSLNNGRPVSGSNYLRIAFATKGIEYIIENPLGIGYGRRSFGRINNITYPNEKIGHRAVDNHSGILSLGIGMGIIGLILFLLFAYQTIKIALKYFSKEINYFSILTFFLVTGFFTRSIVDTNVWDDVFLRFIILLSISFTLMILTTSKRNDEST